VVVDVAAWRAQGLKLRDATSLGAPGWWRLSAQGPQAQQALQRVLGLSVTPEAGDHA
jgi:histidinol-phosphate aminotransferase